MIPSYASYTATSITCTLADAIGVADTEITPSSMTGFPTSKGFVIQIDNELIQVGTTGSTQWYDCVRGVNGTTEAAHAANATVTLMLGEPASEFPLANNGVPWGSASETLILGIDDDRRICSIEAVPSIPTQIAPDLLQMAQVTLTAAEIIAMGTTPVSVLPAPGAGQVIIPVAFHLQTKPGGTAFTGGGVVSFEYHGTSIVPHASSIAAAVVTSATASNNLLPVDAAAIQPPTNTGIDILNATAPFAAGNGTIVVTIWYRVLTLS
jgi:hypothetical protein